MIQGPNNTLLIKLSTTKGSTLDTIQKTKDRSEHQKLEVVEKHGQAERIGIVCLTGQLTPSINKSGHYETSLSEVNLPL